MRLEFWARTPQNRTYRDWEKLKKLLTGIEFPEVGAEACRSRETIPVVGIGRESVFATTPEPCDECGIGAAAFDLIHSGGVQFGNNIGMVVGNVV